MVFNQNPHVAVNTTLRVPLYYSGLDTVARVSREGAAPTAVPLLALSGAKFTSI